MLSYLRVLSKKIIGSKAGGYLRLFLGLFFGRDDLRTGRGRMAAASPVIGRGDGLAGRPRWGAIAVRLQPLGGGLGKFPENRLLLEIGVERRVVPGAAKIERLRLIYCPVHRFGTIRCRADGPRLARGGSTVPHYHQCSTVDSKIRRGCGWHGAGRRGDGFWRSSSLFCVSTPLRLGR